MSKTSRCVLIVLDSVGVGDAPDAASFGDEGADTLGHIAQATGGLKLPNLQRLGLGNLRAHKPLPGCPPIENPQGAFGRLREVAQGKDTATGHWELMGLVHDAPFRTYPTGFPPELMEAFLKAIGRERVLGNEVASGTEIIARLGQEHLASGDPIVYTSVDPVLQIAAHTSRVPLETLYAWCEAAFELAIPAGLSRVIARPFEGEAPFHRTWDRKDFALRPPRPTALDALQQAGIETLGVGKIASIYAYRGIAHERTSRGNMDGVDQTLRAISERQARFVFTNLVDFDQEYGHRRDPAGYRDCLEEFDARLPELMSALAPGDLLMLTADHGNDPTWPGTDHTRELVPILAWTPGMAAGADLGLRSTFSDVGKTVLDFFGVDPGPLPGTSFLDHILPHKGSGLSDR